MSGNKSISVATFGFTINALKQGVLSSLFNNAIYLILNSAAVAILGFVFWNVMARNFAPAVVGIGSALFATAGLISSVAHLGLGTGLVRFVPEVGKKAGHLVNGVLLLTGLFTAFISMIYMVGVNTWSPALGFLTKNYLYCFGFIIMTTAMTISALLDTAFIAQRSAKYVLWKDLIASLVKIPLPVFIFFTLGGYGIFLGSGAAVTLTIIIAFFVFMPKVYDCSACSIDKKIDLSLLRLVLPFSFSNYLAALFFRSVGFIFPLMVLNLKGAESSAYFYMAWLIANVLSIIPGGLSTSLFAECSHSPENLNHHIKRALWLSLILLTLGAGIIYVLANWLLGFFGSSYATYGSGVLRWLLLANFPIAISSFYNTINQVKKKIHLIVLQSFATSGLTIGMGYELLEKMGLTGIGVAYTLANLVVALVVAVPLWKTMNEKVIVHRLDGQLEG